MTEQEWLEGTDPQLLLDYVQRDASTRKARLFGCACCRRIWHLLRDVRSRQGVETAERFADHAVKRKELHRANMNASTVVRAATANGCRSPAYNAAFAALAVTEKEQVGYWAFFSQTVDYVRLASDTNPLVEQQAQTTIIFDIFGNPFRPVTFNPAWRTGNVTAIAQAIYEERRFTDLPILADALEEAGCTSEDILAHCRGGGEHTRGCWVVDLALGKE
jgi:hypothetical protein